jgi:hypothetical protein
MPTDFHHLLSSGSFPVVAGRSRLLLGAGHGPLLFFSFRDLLASASRRGQIQLFNSL